MELFFNRDDLLDVISKFNKISNSKLNPILGTTLFEVNKNEVILSATDTNISASITLLTSNFNDECGTFAVETAMLLNCINKLRDTVKITLKDKMKLSVSSGRTKYSLIANAGEDFPEIQKVDGDMVEFKTDDFISGISSTLYCVAERNDNPRKPESCCVNVTAENGLLSFKAMDGYRITEYSIPIDYTGTPFYAFIPKPSAKFVLDIAAKSAEETIKITKTNSHALFIIGDYKITTSTMCADNYNFNIFKNKQTETIIKVNSNDLYSTIEQAVPIIENSTKNPLKIHLDKGIFTISSVSALGKSNSECAVDMEGQPIEFGVNSKYILEAIKNLSADKIILKIHNPLSPIEVYDADNEHNWSIVLPMRIKTNNAA